MAMRLAPALASLTILAAIPAVHAPPAASAAELSAKRSADEDRKGKVFDLLDENDDGFISVAEFKNNQMLVFYILDRNKDLVLTVDETPIPADVFARIAGPKGTINSVEFLALVDDAFRQADANRDGMLDRQEFATLQRRLRE